MLVNPEFLFAGEKEKPKKQKEHESDMKKTDAIVRPSLTEQITVEPIVPPKKIPSTTTQNLEPLSPLSSFSVASLQQYTNSFMEDNLISKDKMSKVYLAELPDGKVRSGSLVTTFGILIQFLMIIYAFFCFMLRILFPIYKRMQYLYVKLVYKATGFYPFAQRVSNTSMLR